MLSIQRRTLALVVAAAVAAVPFTVSRAEAGCGDLAQAAGLAKKVLNGVCEVSGDVYDCTDVKDGSAKAENLVAKWNAAFENSNLTIGPRTIEFKSTESGTVIAGTKRTFISTRATNLDNALVTIKKRGGKAAQVTICSMDARGVRTPEVTASFSAKDKPGTVKRFMVPKVKGKVVVIQVDAKKKNKFAYDVSLAEK